MDWLPDWLLLADSTMTVVNTFEASMHIVGEKHFCPDVMELPLTRTPWSTCICEPLMWGLECDLAQETSRLLFLSLTRREHPVFAFSALTTKIPYKHDNISSIIKYNKNKTIVFYSCLQRHAIRLTLVPEWVVGGHSQYLCKDGALHHQRGLHWWRCELDCPLWLGCLHQDSLQIGSTTFNICCWSHSIVGFHRSVRKVKFTVRITCHYPPHCGQLVNLWLHGYNVPLV